MNDIKVLKFGGSSLADAEHFLQVKKIVEAEEARRAMSYPRHRADAFPETTR